MVSLITTCIESYFFADSKIGQGTCRSLSVVANLALLAINKANMRRHAIEGTLSNNKLQLYRWSRIFIGLDILGTVFYTLSAIISITQLISILSILAVVTLSMNFFMNSNSALKKENLAENYSYIILLYGKKLFSPEESYSDTYEEIGSIPITQADSIID